MRSLRQREADLRNISLSHGRPRTDFWSHVDKNGPIPKVRPELGNCWIWTGWKYPRGYGKLRHGKKYKRAHRVAYEEINGPLAEGLQPDHLCFVTSCVRPTHLEAVTEKENIRRYWEMWRARKSCVKP